MVHVCFHQPPRASKNYNFLLKKEKRQTKVVSGNSGITGNMTQNIVWLLQILEY
jgi:hypothetical protein